MSYVLDRPCVAGRYTVAIVSRQVLGSGALGRHGAGLHGTKVPAYAVVWDGQGRAVLDMAGARVTELAPSVEALLAEFDKEHTR